MTIEKQELTKNQKLILEALNDYKNFKHNMSRIKSILKIKNNQSVIRAIKALRKKGLIDDYDKPTKKGLTSDSTTTNGIK